MIQCPFCDRFCQDCMAVAKHVITNREHLNFNLVTLESMTRKRQIDWMGEGGLAVINKAPVKECGQQQNLKSNACELPASCWH